MTSEPLRNKQTTEKVEQKWFKEHWKRKYLKNPLFVGPILIATLGVGAYFFYFRDSHLSHNSTDWGSFGSYAYLFIASLNLVLFTALTINIHEYAKTSDVYKRIDNRRYQMPIITFYRWDEPHRYYMKNAGRGPAFNVVIDVMHSNGKWEPGRRYYSISSESEEYSMEYSFEASVIIATYTNLFGDTFRTVMKDDTLRILDYSDAGQRNELGEYFALKGSDSPTILVVNPRMPEIMKS